MSDSENQMKEGGKFVSEFTLWRGYVTRALEDMCGDIEKNSDSIGSQGKKVHDNAKEIFGLKIKAGIWGLFGGMVSGVAALLIYLLSQWLRTGAHLPSP